MGEAEGTGGPLGRQLLARYPVLRRFVVLRALSAVTVTGLIIAQAVGIASILSSLAAYGVAAAAHSVWVPVLVVVLTARATLAYGDRRLVERTVVRWKELLRDRAVTALAARTLPRRDADTGAAVTLLTTGIDAVDAYLAGTLAAVPAAAVTPLGIAATVLALDWPSGLVLLAGLVALPVLLALVGQYTKARTQQQWAALLRLGNQFFEAVSGLATLRVLGRSGRTGQRVREVAEAHRTATVSALRVAFLSSFVLETLTSLAVALVAVPVGFRLLDGDMTLTIGLAVLLLTPEMYLPLRSLGVSFHAGQEAGAALEEFDRLLATAPAAPPRPTTTRPAAGDRTTLAEPGAGVIQLSDVTVGYDRPVLTGVSLTLRPGTCYAIVGASGAGKSSLLRAVAGLLPPMDGRILVDGADLTAYEPHAWYARVAMVTQRPHLFTGTLGDNIRAGARDATVEDVWSALEQAGAAAFVRELADGLDTPVGDRGLRLSSGERQRVALARALVRRPAVLLLDEPTARLDGDTERYVLDALGLVTREATVLMVTHRPAAAERADEVISVAHGRADLLPVLR